jgi:acyl-CoA synthetase (NDP forming)
VLKAECAAPRHASDIDAVLLGLQGDAAVRAGWEELERRVERVRWPWRGVVVEPLVEAGADLLIGTVKDPDYGAVMALGLGGRQAGLGADATVRLPPGTDVEADELIDAAPGLARRLSEFRGQAALDREALRDVVLRFARMLSDMPEILEADLNPTRWMEEGCVVLDARVRVGRLPARPRVKTW